MNTAKIKKVLWIRAKFKKSFVNMGQIIICFLCSCIEDLVHWRLRIHLYHDCMPWSNCVCDAKKNVGLAYYYYTVTSDLYNTHRMLFMMQQWRESFNSNCIISFNIIITIEISCEKVIILSMCLECNAMEANFYIIYPTLGTTRL